MLSVERLTKCRTSSGSGSSGSGGGAAAKAAGGNSSATGRQGTSGGGNRTERQPVLESSNSGLVARVFRISASIAPKYHFTYTAPPGDRFGPGCVSRSRRSRGSRPTPDTTRQRHAGEDVVPQGGLHERVDAAAGDAEDEFLERRPGKGRRRRSRRRSGVRRRNGPFAGGLGHARSPPGPTAAR